MNIIGVLSIKALGEEHDAVVLSLAITPLDLDLARSEKLLSTKQLLKATKTWNFSTEHQEDRTTTPGMYSAWKQKSQEAWDAHRQEPLLDVPDVIELLSEFISRNKVKRLLGSDVSNKILRNLCYTHAEEYPIESENYAGSSLSTDTVHYLLKRETRTASYVPVPKKLDTDIAAHNSVYNALVTQNLVYGAHKSTGESTGESAGESA